MEIKRAQKEDFDKAFDFIKALWSYNVYDRVEVYRVYNEVLADNNSFVFFLVDNGRYKGFCHGVYFNTFWMSGLTCYVSGIIVSEGERKKGYGKALMDCAKELAKERGCKAIILDSGFPRKEAHAFYEGYGFEKSCFGFELMI